MCRNIKTLFNYTPPATEEEIRAASVQFIRKISGSTKPSKVNEAVFKQAIDDVEVTVRELLRSLVTTAPPKDREMERQKAQVRSAQRFGTV